MSGWRVATTNGLKSDVNFLGDDNSLGRHLRDIRQRFDAGFHRPAQPTAVFWIDLIGGAKIIAIAALHDKKRPRRDDLGA